MAKKLIPKFNGIVENHKLEVLEPEKLSLWVKSLKGAVEIIIKERKRVRSLAENNYYWGVVIAMVSLEMGLSNDETHYYLKSQHLREQLQIKGKMYDIIRSTTDLTVIEMEDYLEKVRQWASKELQCYIPLPNEVVN